VYFPLPVNSVVPFFNASYPYHVESVSSHGFLLLYDKSGFQPPLSYIPRLHRRICLATSVVSADGSVEAARVYRRNDSIIAV